MALTHPVTACVRPAAETTAAVKNAVGSKGSSNTTSSIMTVRLMMHQYATRYLPKLARSSFVGLVESMRPSNGGQVRDGFEVKDKDVVRHECSFEIQPTTDQRFVKKIPKWITCIRLTTSSLLDRSGL